MISNTIGPISNIISKQIIVQVQKSECAKPRGCGLTRSLTVRKEVSVVGAGAGTGGAGAGLGAVLWLGTGVGEGLGAKPGSLRI